MVYMYDWYRNTTPQVLPVAVPVPPNSACTSIVEQLSTRTDPGAHLPRRSVITGVAEPANLRYSMPSEPVFVLLWRGLPPHSLYSLSGLLLPSLTP